MSRKRLLIDLDKINRHPEWTVRCSYEGHPRNNGLSFIREMATYALVCRRCEEGTCILACPKEALEKQENGILKRYNMRCVQCRSCSYACPFGTIAPEIVPYRTSTCDYCIGRLRNGEAPLCVQTCPEGAIQYGDFEENPEENAFLVGDNMVIRAASWEKEETA
ncbi:MAG: hypothetical protein P9M00_03510 [Candidatus Tritonobacter lacicola]|nr:hypothetical protein [Candidatus Tritonobacter lacicola]